MATRAKENDSPNKKSARTALRGKSMAALPKEDRLSKYQKGATKSASFVGQDQYALSETDESFVERPVPTDFVEFLPWACGELTVGKLVKVNVINVQEDSISKKDKTKHKAGSPQHQPQSETQAAKESSETSAGLRVKKEDIINIEATYKGNHLIQINFNKNRDVPRKLIQIIGLIIKFHPQLEKVIINSGLTSFTTHEIAKLLPFSNITEIVFDGCFIIEANFHLLLDKPNSLTSLSLARCAIGDKGVKEISQKLVYPLPASTTLAILNLSSNRITDVGAGYIAFSLRSNRRLKYLNLAGNRLTDTGVNKILSTLMPFIVTEEEKLSSKTRYVKYLKYRNEIVTSIFPTMWSNRGLKKKIVKTHEDKKKAKTTAVTAVATFGGVDPELQYITERAESAAAKTCGEFEDPFSQANTTVNDDKLYSNGNFALTYLNIAYNNLSALTLKHLVKVLEYQKPHAQFNNKGIVSVHLEGNPMPNTCDELKQIETCIEKNFAEAHKLARSSLHTQKKRWTNVK